MWEFWMLFSSIMGCFVLGYYLGRIVGYDRGSAEMNRLWTEWHLRTTLPPRQAAQPEDATEVSLHALLSEIG